MSGDVAVVLLAAGSGSRLGSKRPKAFVGVAGEVMLAHSLRVFDAHPAIDAIVLVVPDGWQGATEVLVDDLGCERVSAIEVGGATRADSVLAGLAGVSADADARVLVHDAARPIVTDALIDALLKALDDDYDAVVPVLPVTDTIKEVAQDAVAGEGSVQQTLDRSKLRAAQTPQICRASMLRSALEKAGPTGRATMTDCAQTIESVAGRVRWINGDVASHKITTADDLSYVERLLGGAGADSPADDQQPDVETSPA